MIKTYTKEEVSKLIHDIRNPLTSIISFSKMLIEDKESISPEEREEFIHLIYEESKRINDIIDVFRKRDESLQKKKSLVNASNSSFSDSIQGKAKILVVDNDGSIRRLIKMDLEKIGYTVYTAYNVKEALSFIEKFEPDLIISDVDMPDIDGLGFREELKNRNIIIPFIFLTSDHNEEKRLNGLKLGADAYLGKPFSIEELIVIIESLLEKAKKIAQSVYIDPLIGIYNRKFIEEKLPLRIKNALDNLIPLSLAMCDIDFFKKINDRYGHQIGDKVLRFLGNFLKVRLRGSDIIARYGGEEFLILLENAPKQKAYKVMERLRGLLAKEKIQIDSKKDIQITVSIGISTLEEDGETIDELIEKADKALYEAKSKGRNRIVLAEKSKKEDLDG